MKRMLVTLLVILTFMTPWSALAQDGTPTATTGSGEAVTIYGSDAQPIGTVAIDDLVDPFDAYDAGSQPSRGYRWVMAVVTITAGDKALTPNSSGFSAIDSEGFVAYQSYVYRSSEATAELPDLTGDEIAAGQSRTGVVFFPVFLGSEVTAIEYANTSDMSVRIFSASGSTAQAGDAVSVNGNDGSPMVKVTLTGVVDPLQDYDPGSAPQRGFVYVGVVVTIENTGTRVFQASPYLFSITDFEGFVTTSSGVYRTAEGTAQLPDLGYVDLAPGSSTSGLVSFQLINGAKIASVAFVPSYDRKVRIAEFEAGQPYPEPDLAALPTAVPEDPACADVVAWAQSLTTLLDSISDPISLADAQDLAAGSVDVEALRTGAEELRAAADQVAGMDAPEIAADAQSQIVDVLKAIADDLDKMADAAEAKDQAAFDAAKADTTTELMGLIGEGPYMDLATRCPALMDT